MADIAETTKEIINKPEIPGIPPYLGIAKLENPWNHIGASTGDILEDAKALTVGVWAQPIQFPNLIKRRTIGQLLLKNFMPDVEGIVRKSFPAPSGYIKLLSKPFWDKQTAINLLHYKSRFPLLETEDVIITAGMAAELMKDYNAKFDHTSRTLMLYNFLLLTDLYRAIYTVKRLAQFATPFMEYDFIKMVQAEGIKINKENLIVNMEMKRAEAIEKGWAALWEIVKKGVTTEMPGGNEHLRWHYDRGIGINKIPYRRFRNQAVFKIDNFYLFLDELVSFQESFVYPFTEQKHLHKNTVYRSGDVSQSVTIKAVIYFTRRFNWDYFVRLGNKKRFLRFVVSLDDQERFILIQSIDSDYRFQYSTDYLKAPRPVYANVTIKGLIRGVPLPPFELKDYTKPETYDPSVLDVADFKESSQLVAKGKYKYHDDLPFSDSTWKKKAKELESSPDITIATS